VHNSDESNEMLQVSGTYHGSYPAAEEPQPVQNIDMFMACCDWEAAIQEEKAERESGQKIANDMLLETQQDNSKQSCALPDNQNHGTDDNMNLTNNKSCKRKLKMDLKSRNH